MGDAVRSVLRACELLKAFRYEGETLRLADLVARTGLSKATAFRILRSLEEGQLIERIGKDRYRSAVRAAREPQARVGFAITKAQTTFSQIVNESVGLAAREAGLSLVMADNRHSRAVAIRNAERLVQEGVDLVIEYQVHERAAASVSSRFIDVGIPVIAIDVPHPGATYFGANNHQAGVMAGRATAAWIRERWKGQADEIILLEERLAGALPRLRLTGALSILQQELSAARYAITELDGKGALGPSLEAVRRYLRIAPPRKTLVIAGTDPSALGALDAFEEAGRSELCAVVGYNGQPEARKELRRPGTRMICSVAFFPERYGCEVIRLALDLLAGKPVPPANFITHQALTPANVDRIYGPEKELPEWLARGPLSIAAAV